MSKRLLDVQCRLANATGAQFIRLVPGNLYGPHDHFSSDRAHVIPALVHSLKGKTGKVAIHGRPDTLRQFVHASDFCEIISEHVNVLLNGQFDESNSILNIVHKEYTLDEVVRAINPNVVPDWSYKDVGQFKKTCLPNKAISREWTPLERGLKDL
jgi:nucleoside-diphosphate-sugar epimerase